MSGIKTLKNLERFLFLLWMGGIPWIGGFLLGWWMTYLFLPERWILPGGVFRCIDRRLCGWGFAEKRFGPGNLCSDVDLGRGLSVLLGVHLGFFHGCSGFQPLSGVPFLFLDGMPVGTPGVQRD